MLTISHSTCSTARLFSLKSLFDTEKKNIIITDNLSDISLMQTYKKTILNQDIYILKSFDEFWMMYEKNIGNFCIPTSLLEFQGNLEYLKKHSLYEIQRNSTEKIENIIEKLIDF